MELPTALLEEIRKKDLKAFVKTTYKDMAGCILVYNLRGELNSTNNYPLVRALKTEYDGNLYFVYSANVYFNYHHIN